MQINSNQRLPPLFKRDDNYNLGGESQSQLAKIKERYKELRGKLKLYKVFLHIMIKSYSIFRKCGATKSKIKQKEQ